MEDFYRDFVTNMRVPADEGLFLQDLDPLLLDLIRKDYPNAAGGDFISQRSLMHYRLKKINNMIESDNKVNKRLRDRFNKLLSNESYQEIDVQKYLDENNTFGQKVADAVAKFGGSWPFIIGFMVVLGLWVLINTFHVFGRNFDPYPFILLNLGLSMLAAVQAPLIMMSQNRSGEYDRLESQNDYRVNKKTETEIRLLHSKVDHLIQKDQPNILEIQRLQTEMISEISRQLDDLKEEIGKK